MDPGLSIYPRLNWLFISQFIKSTMETLTLGRVVIHTFPGKHKYTLFIKVTLGESLLCPTWAAVPTCHEGFRLRDGKDSTTLPLQNTRSEMT
jgi:hypothetical protein